MSVLGLLIGVLYMNLLARPLPLGGAAKPATAGELVTMVLRQWLMVMLFIVAVTCCCLRARLP